jgi:DNA-binding transcriptional ArsR family regulator
MTERIAQQATGEAQRRPAMREPLSDEAIESVAAWLRVIAEPTRIRLMEALNAGAASVQGLAARVGASRQNVSKHLNVLYQAGIVRRRKVKNHVHYELVDWTGTWLIEQVGMSVTAEHEGREATARRLRNCATA